MDMPTRVSVSPGKTLIQYCPANKYWYPLAMSKPKEGSLAGSPPPKNDNVASKPIAAAD